MSPGWRPLRTGFALVLAALLLAGVAALPALADTTYGTPAYDDDTRADAAHRITPESDEAVVRWVDANRASSSAQGHVYDWSASFVAPRTPGGAGPVRVGQEGLDALGVTQNTTRIPRPSGTGYRVPDILDEAGGVIGEVKNVQSLSCTQQLRDYAWYAQQNGYQFDLYVRGSTSLSGPLQTAVDDGVINLHRALPG